jgi:PPOX class probable F420-dependent enzyme
MTDEEIADFIVEQRTAIICSMHPNGSIHAVPMWYGVVGGMVIIQTKAKSQKIQNLRRDPRLTFVIETGQSYDQLRGVELVGQAEFIDDPAELWELALNIYGRCYGPVTEDQYPIIADKFKNRLGVRLRVQRTVSWDHRKMAAPPAS